MKGVSNWFWIAAGVVAGLVVFSIAYTQIAELNKAKNEQRALEQYDEVKNIINNLCWTFAGNKREYEVSLTKSIEGFYVADNKYQSYEKDQMIDRIINQEETTGNFLCLKVEGKRLRCDELYCNTTMPFLGSVPKEYSLSALVNEMLGRGEVFNYPLKFEKKDTDVEVELGEFSEEDTVTTVPGGTTTTTSSSTTTTTIPDPRLSCNSINSPSDLPSSWDWSHVMLNEAPPSGGENWMSKVKTQASCGSCWAFSTVGVVEANYKIEQGNTNLNPDLSEQNLVSECCPYGSCNGGPIGQTLGYISNYGIGEETCFNYQSGNCMDPNTHLCLSNCFCSFGCSNPCSCKSCSNLWKIDYYYVQNTEFQIKKNLVCRGPLSVAVTVQGPDPDHAVVLVGYDDSSNQWIMKNSWGVFTDWDPYNWRYHKNGYFYNPYYDISNVYGVNNVRTS